MNPIPDDESLASFYATDSQTRNVMGSVDFELLQRKSADDTSRRMDWLTRSTKEREPMILDIGSGYGFFVEHARQAGLNAVGLEPSRERVTLARQHSPGQFINGILDDQFVAQHANRYDVVSMFHVIEHLRTPRRIVQSALRLLKPGGTLLIEVPNLGDWLLQVLPAYRAFYWQYAHVSYFGVEQLKLLLETAIGSSFTISGVQRYGVRNLLHWINEASPQLAQTPESPEHAAFMRLEEIYKIHLEGKLICDTLTATCRLGYG